MLYLDLEAKKDIRQKYQKAPTKHQGLLVKLGSHLGTYIAPCQLYFFPFSSPTAVTTTSIILHNL